MIEIAVCQKDQFEIARLAARSGKFLFNLGTPIAAAGVDQKKSGLCGDEITVDTAQPVRERQTDWPDVQRHASSSYAANCSPRLPYLSKSGLRLFAHARMAFQSR
jgi:hypothetical protein